MATPDDSRDGTTREDVVEIVAEQLHMQWCYPLWGVECPHHPHPYDEDHQQAACVVTALETINVLTI